MSKEETRLQTLKAARERLMEVTPLKRDCGALCGSACCRTDEDGLGGMLLFPGEEAFYRDLPEGFSIAEDKVFKGAKLLTCEGFCDRADRPLACRVFPMMFVEKEGGADVALDPRAWPLCPLMPSGLTGLKAEFVEAAREAAALLFSDSEIKEFMLRQEKLVRDMTRPLWD